MCHRKMGARGICAARLMGGCGLRRRVRGTGGFEGAARGADGFRGEAASSTGAARPVGGFEGGWWRPRRGSHAPPTVSDWDSSIFVGGSCAALMASEVGVQGDSGFQWWRVMEPCAGACGGQNGGRGTVPPIFPHKIKP
ncbi:hypothetical protein GUJ93_ZPchr0015g6831 [Zizania palustris]|uniref:Uncharacterized protein n=1 Tax=Zizania palustris TaxID=103762 RepID=A0A8J5SYY2_ZIZPA|nr:hypothetical protein GUJ93_ZPchr0015g6831 [Zizania palustris]